MLDPLEGVKLKIERANAHIRECSDLIDAYNALDTHQIFHEDDAAKGIRALKVRVVQQPPLTISVVAGDILYLLRSALDHLVTVACTRRGHEMIHRTGFPIECTREEFESVCANRKIEKRLPKVFALLSELQPYKGGNDLLWWLHWLNGREKHKTLLTVAGAHTGMRAEFKATVAEGAALGETITFQHPKRWQRLDKEAILFTHPLGLNLDGNVDLTFHIIFADVESSEPYTLTDSLQQMSDLTAGIVSAFETRGLIPAE